MARASELQAPLGSSLPCLCSVSLSTVEAHGGAGPSAAVGGLSPSSSPHLLDPNCVICLDERKSVLLLPCSHLCVCEGCADRSFAGAQMDRCPLCRAEVAKVHRGIFV